MSCLESKNSSLVEHLLRDCNLIGKIVEAEKNCTLAADSNKVVQFSIIVDYLFTKIVSVLVCPCVCV